MSRSCHSATFSSAGLRVAAQHAREAGDLLGLDRVALVRHRRGALLPRAERLLHLAHLGALQVADLRRQALQAGARPARSRCSSSAWRSRATTCVETSSRARPSRASTRASNSGLVAAYVPDRARDARRRRPARTRAAGAARCGAASKAKPASLTPKVVGSACTPCVRPTHSVSPCSRARRDSAATSPYAPGDDHLAGRAQLQRQRRVEHVRGGQAEVDPAPGLARPRRRARRRTRPRRGRSRARAR